MFRAEEVNTGTNESEFGCDPQDSVGKFTYICQFKRVDGNKRKNVFLKKRTYILTFSLPLPSQLLRHPIVMKVTVPFRFYCNSHDQMRKSTGIQINWTNCLHYKTLQIYKASDSLQISDSESIETGADPHRFPPFYGNRSHFSY